MGIKTVSEIKTSIHNNVGVKQKELKEVHEVSWCDPYKFFRGRQN